MTAMGRAREGDRAAEAECAAWWCEDCKEHVRVIRDGVCGTCLGRNVVGQKVCGLRACEDDLVPPDRARYNAEYCKNEHRWKATRERQQRMSAALKKALSPLLEILRDPGMRHELARVLDVEEDDLP